MNLKLLETEVLQKRIEDYNKEEVAIIYYVDSLSNVNSYHDLGRLDLLIKEKLKQLKEIKTIEKLTKEKETIRKLKPVVRVFNRFVRGY